MRRFALFSFTGFALIAGTLAAQDPSRGPDSSSSTHVPGIILLPIPGKPISGVDNIEWTRTLEDGTTITTHTTANLARDSRGRMYRENHHFVPLDQKSPLYQIHIYDPVSRSQVYCSTVKFQCVVTDYLPQKFFTTTPAGDFDNGNRSLARDSLGSQSIEGIFVNGTRETTTVNPGVLGNDRPLVSTREFWYSDELETNLAVTRIDPREGTQRVWISGISRSEPDTHLFDIPIGYTVRDDRASARRSR
ncbi:MAG: hypothetical protein ABSE46_16000 [Terracidiphilus sp.]|jgi:hypothetical protein